VGPSQGSQDGVLDFLSAGRASLRFRLGLQFRGALQPTPPADSLLPARYVRLQVASPPPDRVDGTAWHEGLRDSDGAPFDPDNPPADGKVDPVQGIAPLDQPDPSTIVLDRWLAVPVVPPTGALTRAFTLGTPDPKKGPLSFLSVPYPQPSVKGTGPPAAGVTYYTQEEIDFDPDRSVHEGWIAVSLSRFFPPERASADYIVQVRSETGKQAQRVRTFPSAVEGFPVDATWTRADP